MYIRAVQVTNDKSGTAFTCHQLVECHRTEKGPRQRLVMNLGTLSLPRGRWRELSGALEAGVTGQQVLFPPEPEIAALAKALLASKEVKPRHRPGPKPCEDDVESDDLLTIKVSSLSTSNSRSLGPELVGHTFYQRLGFPEMLDACGLDAYQRDLAEAVIVGRLVAPDSDLRTWHWLRSRTSLPELLASDLEKAGKDAVYETADRLWQHRTRLEAGLRERESALYPRGETVILYDLTNTHFEGRCLDNALAKRGHSKQKRSDCPLVTLALVVDAQGFPLFSQIYEGNQVEPMTLVDVLKRLQDDGNGLFKGVKPTLVMDRGIATKENLTLMRKEQYPFLVIQRRDEAKVYESHFQHAPQGFQEIKDRKDGERVWLKKIDPLPAQTEDAALARVLCYSEGRAEKERGIDRLKEQRLLVDLEKVRRAIDKNNLRDCAKANQRIGRLLQRYPSIAPRYRITLAVDAAGTKLTGITWERTAQVQTRETLQGCYVISTTHLDLDAERVWNLYMSLARVEAAFKALKSDLGLRPVRHHSDDRTRAHLFVSVLAYHLLASIERTLRMNGDRRCWATILSELSTHQRSTVGLRDEKDETHEVRLSGTPEPVHQEIYRLLAVKNPLARRRSRRIARL
jgi:transposase